MKKLSLLFASICMLFTAIYAQEDKDVEFSRLEYQPKNTIYLAPFNFAFREIQVGYEHQFEKNNSIVIKTNGSYIENTFSGFNEKIVLGLEMQYRQYFLYKVMGNIKRKKRTNLYGLYLAPFAAYQYSKVTDFVFDQTGQNFRRETVRNAPTVGMYLGNRMDFAKGRVTLDIYFGSGIKFSNFNDDNNNLQPVNFNNGLGGIHQIGVNGFIPKGNVELGFNF